MPMFTNSLKALTSGSYQTKHPSFKLYIILYMAGSFSSYPLRPISYNIFNLRFISIPNVEKKSPTKYSKLTLIYVINIGISYKNS